MAVRPAARQILVLDDETASRAWLRKMLSDAGYKVFTARSAQEAADAARDHLLDMALVGMGIPEAERRQAVQSLQAAYPLIKIVATTKVASAETLRAADLMGAQSILARPFTASMTLPRLRELLKLHPTPYVATP
jgi:CheY-like chemotaxis protein